MPGRRRHQLPLSRDGTGQGRRRRVDERGAYRPRLNTLNAFISRTAESGSGPRVAVKDNIDVAGLPTTAGRASGPVAAADAACVAELRRRGAVIVGKTNLHELALGVTSENPHWGPVRNPRFPDRVAGGSSGGSAAAVVAGLCDWAVGTDTGGSIRIPAAFCGCVGFKPTPGLISTEGVFPLSPTLDVVGPLAPDVRTAARAFDMLSGRAFAVPALDRVRLATPAGWFDDLDEWTRSAWSGIAAEVQEIDVRHWSELGAPGLVIIAREAPVEREPRPAEAEYQAALELRTEVEFAGYDALILPACPRVAPLIGASGPGTSQLMTRFTLPFNVSGQPAVSIPAPVGDDELPVGIQLVGRRGDDARLLAVAAWLEAAWSSRS